MNNKTNCTTIPPGESFLELLASWLNKEYGQSPMILARALVLLPNRRSCRALREAFLRISGGKAQLLPRIHSLGDLADDEGTGLPEWMPNVCPQACMTLERRQFLLTKLILALEPDYTPAHGFELARELANFMDEVIRHELDMAALATLAPDHLSGHWQRTLDFLKLLTQHWPRILEEEGLVDPAEQRHQAYITLASQWRNHPPSHPVIAAGSTGSQPATAALLGTIAHLPNGRLILPGLDQALSAFDWETLGPTHPQYVFKELLERIGLARGDIKPLFLRPNAKQDMLRLVFAPAEATARWKNHPTIPAGALQSIKLLTADTQTEEARFVAILLREALETPGKTVALVTPDRALATMVTAQMRRFGVMVDDSAGIPLLDTPVGVLMQLALNWMDSDFSPVALLALLRHPLAGLGIDSAHCRGLSRELEIKLLRGLRRHDSLEHMASVCGDTSLASLLRRLDDISLTLRRLYGLPRAELCDLMHAHIAFCEALASTNREDGVEILWQKESGNQLAETLINIIASAQMLPAIQPSSYGALFRGMLSQHVFRPSFGQHPRVSILSPIEARLQHYDRVVLASLNEGVWPSQPPSNPWLSQSMRADFGLPPATRSIGQSAHDIFQLMASDEVFLTRARKVSGMLQVPSRWLVRMQILIEGQNSELWQSMQVAERYHTMLSSLDKSEPLPAHTKPKPVPPLAMRPTSLSTTAIEKFTRNPYDCYAETILRLRPLDPLEEEPSSKHFGQVIHRAMEQFTKRHPKGVPANIQNQLRECGLVAFAEMLEWPAVKALWWPRFESILPWLEQAERESRALSRLVLAEQNVKWQLPCNDYDFTITSRIDRLDIRSDGTVGIVDYKTGSLLNQTDIDQAEINQLALYALCLSHGELLCGQPGMPDNADLYTLHYWRLAGRASECMNQQVSTDLAQAKERLIQVISRYRDPGFAFESHDDPGIGIRHSAYAHLNRRAEWDSL